MFRRKVIPTLDFDFILALGILISVLGRQDMKFDTNGEMVRTVTQVKYRIMCLVF